VEHHKGEISFPGGRVDPDDSDLLHTALREGAEEIGLDPRHVTILGGGWGTGGGWGGVQKAPG